MSRRSLGFVLNTLVSLALLAPASASAATPAPQPVPAKVATLPAAIEELPAYVGATSCDYTAKPGVVRFAALLQHTYAGTGSSGIVNTCAAEGSRSEHTEGRAFDWTVSASSPQQVAQVHALFAWLLAKDKAGNEAANARRLGLMYLIWNKQIYGLYDVAGGWKPYSCSGVTGCHQDHVHFSFTWAGARGVTSYWTGKVAPQEYGPCLGHGQTYAHPVATPRLAPCPDAAPLTPTDPLVTALKATPTAVIREGSHGALVTALQRALGGVPVTGTFGAQTTDLLTGYQKRHRLAATGALDAATRANLLNTVTGGAIALPAPSVAKPTTPKPPAGAAPAPTPIAAASSPLTRWKTTTLRLGSKGPAVTALQHALGMSGTGYFGPITLGKVKTFQVHHHLAATGVVTLPTWRALGARPVRQQAWIQVRNSPAGTG